MFAMKYEKFKLAFSCNKKYNCSLTRKRDLPKEEIANSAFYNNVLIF